MSDALGHAALAVSGMLFAGLWEGAIIVTAVLLFMCALPTLGASTRYAVWFTALIMLVIAPVCTIALSGRGETQAAFSAFDARPVIVRNVNAGAPAAAPPRLGAHYQTSPAVIRPRSAQPRQIDIPLAFSAAIAILWLLLASARVVVLAVHLRRLSELRRSAETLRAAYGYTVLSSRRTSVPLAMGFLRPAAVLPASLSAELSASELDAIVMHEVAHLRRYDVWTNALARILEALLVLNPFAWFVTARLSVEREIACDDWVVARLDAGEIFANTLANMVCRPAFASIAAPSAIGSKHAVLARIERLLDRRPRRLRVSPAALTGVLLLSAIFATIVPSFSPALALAAQASPHPNAAGCTDRPVLVEALDKNLRPTGRWVPLASANLSHLRNPKSTRVDATIDASGKLRKLTVISAPHARDAKAATWVFTRQHYRAAVVNCKAVASTVHLGAVIDIAAPTAISIVRANYPYGWSSEHPGACRVPDLTHGGVPDVRLVTNKPLTASVLVRVDASGRARHVALIHSSGNAAYDAATLAAARGDAYPLSERTGFKPVRPSGASLSWNATHGYSTYSKCAPLPAEYVWTAMFPPAAS